MKYYIRSGKLYAAGASDPAPCLCSIVSPFCASVKSVADREGRLLLKTSVSQEKAETYPQAKTYLMESPSGEVLARGKLLYADGENPQCLGRLPRVDRVTLRAGGRPYTLRMRNSQYYVLSSEESRAMEIVHNQSAGGWNVETTEEFPPGMVMGLFIFSRYLDKENEFVIV